MTPSPNDVPIAALVDRLVAKSPQAIIVCHGVWAWTGGVAVCVSWRVREPKDRAAWRSLALESTAECPLSDSIRPVFEMVNAASEVSALEFQLTDLTSTERSIRGVFEANALPVGKELRIRCTWDGEGLSGIVAIPVARLRQAAAKSAAIWPTLG